MTVRDACNYENTVHRYKDNSRFTDLIRAAEPSKIWLRFRVSKRLHSRLRLRPLDSGSRTPWSLVRRAPEPYDFGADKISKKTCFFRNFVGSREIKESFLWSWSLAETPEPRVRYWSLYPTPELAALDLIAGSRFTLG